MNVNSPYIPIYAIQTNTEIIPIWDKRINYNSKASFHDGDGYYPALEVENDYHTYTDLIECLYDVENHEVCLGIEVNVYSDIEYFVGEEVYREKPRTVHILHKDKVVDIKYEEFRVEILKGKDLYNWDLEELEKQNISFDPKAIYYFKRWKPTYYFEIGTPTEYTGSFYKIEN